MQAGFIPSWNWMPTWLRVGRAIQFPWVPLQGLAVKKLDELWGSPRFWARMVCWMEGLDRSAVRHQHQRGRDLPGPAAFANWSWHCKLSINPGPVFQLSFTSLFWEIYLSREGILVWNNCFFPSPYHPWYYTPMPKARIFLVYPHASRLDLFQVQFPCFWKILRCSELFKVGTFRIFSYSKDEYDLSYILNIRRVVQKQVFPLSDLLFSNTCISVGLSSPPPRIISRQHPKLGKCRGPQFMHTFHLHDCSVWKAELGYLKSERKGGSMKRLPRQIVSWFCCGIDFPSLLFSSSLINH